MRLNGVSEIRLEQTMVLFAVKRHPDNKIQHFFNGQDTHLAQI